MPMYDFRCLDCGSARELLATSVDARALELVCTTCGGLMRMAPSRVNHLRTGGDTGSQQDGTPEAAQQRGGGCGHRYACRCAGVKLTRPNPFQDQIKAARQTPPID